MPKLSQSQLDASRKYANKFDDIKLRVPKGDREVIRRAAESTGVSVNEFICELVYAEVNRLITEGKVEFDEMRDFNFRVQPED